MLWKSIILAAAAVMLALSFNTAFALPPREGGSGDSFWTVTCTYDGLDHLVSKVCTSGGSHKCQC
jgi:hypothetical protein